MLVCVCVSVGVFAYVYVRVHICVCVHATSQDGNNPGISLRRGTMSSFQLCGLEQVISYGHETLGLFSYVLLPRAMLGT